MNEVEGIVERLDGSFAVVRTAGPAPACGACAQQGGCANGGAGTPLDNPLGKSRQIRLLRLPNQIGARSGDVVIVRSVDGMLIKAVWRAYGRPLALALLGALLASLTGSDGLVMAGLLAGLAAGFWLMRRHGLDAGNAEPILSIRLKPSPIHTLKGQ